MNFFFDSQSYFQKLFQEHSILIPTKKKFEGEFYIARENVTRVTETFLWNFFKRGGEGGDTEGIDFNYFQKISYDTI